MDTTVIVKHYAAQHNAGEPKFKAQLSALRKVAQRAVDAWEKAPIRGASPAPFVHERLAKFCSALQSDTTPADDVDLLPGAHPARAPASDPWAALESAEDRLASLAKSAISAVSRTALRKQSTDEIGKTHRHLAHLYTLNFTGNDHKTSATGVQRDALVKAAAEVHEELERRGVEVSPQHDLYHAALELRTNPPVEMTKGTIFQYPDVVILDMPGVGKLALPQRLQGVELQKAAEAWSVEGSKWHLAMREPAEIVYAVRLDDGAPEGQPIGEFSFSPGAVTKQFTEVFVTGALSGVLIVGPETLTLRKNLQPYVLTEAAVAAGWMPPDGQSALPASLEQSIPPSMRFWKAAEGEDATEIRNQLVATGWLDADSISSVNGRICRVESKTYLAKTFPPAPQQFARALPEVSPLDELSDVMGVSVLKAQEAGHALVESGAVGDVQFILVDDAAGLSPEDMVAKVANATDKYCLGAPDSAEMRKAMSTIGRPFKMSGQGIFVSSHHIHGAEYVDGQESAAPTTSASLKLLKSANDELRYVLGVVLEPETEDAQADIYSADEIRKSAHTFLSEFRNVGLQHQALINDKVRIVESYLAPADMELNNQVIKAGTWMLGVIVDDDDVWAAVKDGSITGFSIGGSGIRTPEL